MMIIWRAATVALEAERMAPMLRVREADAPAIASSVM